MLTLIFHESAMACTRVYKFMSERHSKEKLSHVNRVINVVCENMDDESLHSIQWDDLAQKIFWPIGISSLSAPFIIYDKDLPAIESLFKTAKKGDVLMGNQKCAAYDISIMGTRGQTEEDARRVVKGIRLTGVGRALVCEDSKFPDAVSIKFKRVIEPALWSTVDHEIVEEISIAWTIIP